MAIVTRDLLEIVARAKARPGQDTIALVTGVTACADS